MKDSASTCHAIQAASSQHDFKLLVAGDGRTATSMDDLVGRSEQPSETPPPAAPREPVPVGPPPSSNGAHSATPLPTGRPSAPPPGLLG